MRMQGEVKTSKDKRKGQEERVKETNDDEI